MINKLAAICDKLDSLNLHNLSAQLTDVMVRISEEEKDDDDIDDEHLTHEISKDLETAMNSISRILDKIKRKEHSVKYSENLKKECDSISDLVKVAENNKNKKLNKPFRTPGGPKKFSVYVKNEKGNVVKVNFGDPNMRIKDNIPGRRKNFRARHHCDTPGPKWKANYWSCRQWSDNKSDI